MKRIEFVSDRLVEQIIEGRKTASVVHLDARARGGLSCGKFTLHEHKNNVIFTGAPMVDAVNLE